MNMQKVIDVLKKFIFDYNEDLTDEEEQFDIDRINAITFLELETKYPTRYEIIKKIKEKINIKRII